MAPRPLTMRQTAHLAAVAAALLIPACATNPVEPGGTFDRVNRELSQAAAPRPKAAEPEAVKNALLPPMTFELTPTPPKPVEPRFDLAVNAAPATQVFMSIVTGTRYSMLVHPDVSGNVTVNLKDVTVREVLDTMRDLYGYEYAIQGTRIMIQSNSLQSRVFQVNYLSGRRRGMTDVRVTSGSISTGATNTASSSGATPAVSPLAGTTGTTNTTPLESSRVATTSDSDFWPELTTALKSIVGTEGGRSVVVSPHSGVIVVRAYPRELRNVETFLKATQLVVERQVMLEAKIIEVQLKEDFQAGINWAYFNNSGQHRGSVGADTRNFSIPDGTIRDGLSSLGGTIGSGLASAAGRTATGIFGLALQTGNFAALIQFLEGQGNVQVLSSPRIATLNNQKAVLKVGTDEFFITNVSSSTSATGNTTTTSPTITVQPFFSGIALDVTPQIDENANIILHIHPSVSVVAEKTKVLNLGNLGLITLPLASSNINETDSIVRVQDGNIVAIGGLMKQEQSTDKSQIPVAGEVPLAGALFGQRSTNFLKREIVILLKPTVIDGERGWQQDILDTQGRVQAMDPRASARGQ